MALSGPLRVLLHHLSEKIRDVGQAGIVRVTNVLVPCQNSMQVLDQVFFWVG
jgi:hypothetical protein